MKTHATDLKTTQNVPEVSRVIIKVMRKTVRDRIANREIDMVEEVDRNQRIPIIGVSERRAKRIRKMHQILKVVEVRVAVDVFDEVKPQLKWTTRVILGTDL